MLSKLECFNDPNFTFDPISHSYAYINPETKRPIQIFESVSGFISQFKKPFEAEKIAGFVAKRRGVSRATILAEWAATAKEGTDLGTWVHEWIEDWYNGINPPEPTLNEGFDLALLDPMGTFDERKYDRVQKFKELYKLRLYKLKAEKQELRIFSRKWGIAGTLDSLFSLNERFYIGDWKTNKKFTDDKHPDGRRQKLLYPFNDLWDNNLNGYSLQLSMYRLMLEEAGFETDGAFLAWVGPDAPMLRQTLDLRDKLREFLTKNNFGF